MVEWITPIEKPAIAPCASITPTNQASSSPAFAANAAAATQIRSTCAQSAARKAMNLEDFEVICQTEWQIHHGGVSNPMGGIVGNLTEIEVDGITAYVRENVRYNSFRVSSGERLAMKTKGRLPKGTVHVLELAAPIDYWDEIAQVVSAVDALTRSEPREVFRSQRFTEKWAQFQFKQAAFVWKLNVAQLLKQHRNKP